MVQSAPEISLKGIVVDDSSVFVDVYWLLCCLRFLCCGHCLIPAHGVCWRGLRCLRRQGAAGSYDCCSACVSWLPAAPCSVFCSAFCPAGLSVLFCDCASFAALRSRFAISLISRLSCFSASLRLCRFRNAVPAWLPCGSAHTMPGSRYARRAAPC